jgi:hypothetical protein
MRRSRSRSRFTRRTFENLVILPRRLRQLANEARVTLDRPHPSAELAPPRSGMSAVVLTGRAICVPFRPRRLRFATVNHGHS